MKFRFCLLSLFAVLIVSTTHAFAASPNISPTEARKMIEKGENLFLLDVRTPREFFDARIEGAKLIPDQVLSSRLSEIPMDRPIIVYCAVGYRSSNVVQFLLSRGYRKVYNLYGGIWAWRLKGYPVLKGPP